jgi:hypothetical protein
MENFSPIRGLEGYFFQTKNRLKTKRKSWNYFETESRFILRTKHPGSSRNRIRFHCSNKTSWAQFKTESKSGFIVRTKHPGLNSKPNPNLVSLFEQNILGLVETESGFEVAYLPYLTLPYLDLPYIARDHFNRAFLG